MQVHRSKGITTLKLTATELRQLRTAAELAWYMARLPDLSEVADSAKGAHVALTRLIAAVSKEEVKP